MRKIIVSVFVSMDGVMQAPGGPTEDITNNFKLGGWTVHYTDQISNQTLMALLLEQDYDLLLGRRTYDIFAGYWPFYNDNPIGQKFNNAHKYVVSARLPQLGWDKTTLISGDVVARIKELKEQNGPALLVQGSANLLQTLFKHQLVDELHTYIHPIILGSGKKLFDDGLTAGEWQLVKSQITTKSVIATSYIPSGDVKTGSFGLDNPSDKEKARRQAMEKGEW